jgi:hypothetical protein
MLKFIDSVTGRQLVIDYGSISATCFKPGDSVAILHRFHLVMLEGRCLKNSGVPCGAKAAHRLADGLYGLLLPRRVSTIRTFCAARFASPAPGEAVVERLVISDELPTRTDWERWVSTQTEATA